MKSDWKLHAIMNLKVLEPLSPLSPCWEGMEIVKRLVKLTYMVICVLVNIEADIEVGVGGENLISTT